MSFIIIFSPRAPYTKYNWINKFVKVINGWHLIREKKRVIFTVTLLSCTQLLLSSFMLYLQFQVFGFHISFINALFLSSLGSLGILIAVTPANLGISEAIAVFSALTLGIPASQSLSVALLGRVIQIIVLFILGPICSYLLLKKSPQNHERNDS